jgi:hypothetical protein
MKRNRLNQKGQAIIEFGLILPFFFFFVFAVTGVALFMVEDRLGLYASYMSARSYQVYGGQDEDASLILNQNLKKKYQNVFYSIMSNAYPYVGLKSSSVAAFVDTSVAPQEFSEKFSNYDYVLSHYGINKTAPGIMLALENPKPEKPNVRFGVLKTTFPMGFWFLPELDILKDTFTHEIYVPYRLEARLDIHGY